MPTLSPDAADTIRLVRELELLDETSIRLLEQLFTNRLDEELVNSLIHGKEEAVAVALFKVCAGTHSVHIIGFALRFFADLVCVDSPLGAQLGREDLYGRFGAIPAQQFLTTAQQYHDKLGITNPAIYLAATALRHGDPNNNKESFDLFFSFMKTAFSPDTLYVKDVEFGVQACVQLARRKELRHLFFENDMVQYIPRLLTDIVSNDSASIIQLIYETLLLTWLLSFEYEGIVQLVRHRIIPQLHRVLQRVQKEKCVRVTLMALWNMVEAERKYVQHQLNPNFTEWVDPTISVLAKLQERHEGPGGAHGAPIHGRRGPSLVAEMVSVGMIKTLNQLMRRKFGDEDILVLVEDLNRALEQNMEVLTSFSEYRGEVLSSYLEWTPVHTSAKFWKENAQKFEENNYEVLSMLGKLILETKSEVTLAVACHDLGEVVRYHPTGRNLLTLACLAGVKERVMTLMSHPHAEIAKEALLCTQKIMVQRWEFIQS